MVDKNNEFKDAEILINGMDYAKKVGMLYEYTQWFLDSYSTGDSAEVAHEHSCREWDI